MRPILDVQRLDTELEQLRHRRASLPARAVLAEAAASLAEHEAAAATVSEERHRIDRDQRRYEDEVASLTEKAAHADRLLYGGTVTAIKELQALQEEIAALGRRQRELEDRILELMVEAEPVDERLAELEAARAAAAATADAAAAEVAAGEAEVDAQIAVATAGRAEAAAAADPGLLARYEAMRRQFASSTVVTFDGRGCVGCPLSMPAMEVDRIKHEPEGAVLECDECGRIVLR